MTEAQTEALRWTAVVTGATKGTLPSTPRRDVLGRLAAQGLVDIQVRWSRNRNQNRWNSSIDIALTEAGRQALGL